MKDCRKCKYRRPGDVAPVCIAAPLSIESYYEFCHDKNYRGDCRDYAPKFTTRFREWIQGLNLRLDK